MLIDAFPSAVDMANAIKAKQLSPTEVMQDCIESIQNRNPSLNALVFTAFDEAMDAAQKAEAAVMNNTAKGDFFGVPTAYKDFLPGVPGWPTTFGGLEAVRQLDSGWGLWPKTLVEQGAILVGRTNSPTLALRGLTDNKLFGPTSTPFKIGWNSGGSSGGSTAAVSDGIFAMASTSDAGGSTRIPAAWCGVYGFKSSVGTVPAVTRPNGWVAQFPYAIEGEASRTVKDTVYATQHLAGFDSRDPLSYERDAINYLDSLNGSVKGMKIGVTTNFDLFPVDPEIADSVEKAALRFVEVGAIVEKVDFHFKHTPYEYAEAWCRTAAIASFSRLEGFKKQGIDLVADFPEQLNQQVIMRIKEAAACGYSDWLADLAIRTEIYDEIQNAFDQFDLIISPVTICFPVKNSDDGDTLGPTEFMGVPLEPTIGFSMTYFYNFTGHPAASVPLGLSRDGFPLSMQIAGRRFHDFDVLTASAVFEKIQPWLWMYRTTAERDL